MNRIFYVYLHLTPDTHEVFYAGKGHGTRAYTTTRNNFWKNIVKKHGGFNVDFLYTGLTEDEAFYLETATINRIGRRDLGTGPLINLTDGGKGSSGNKPSELSKEKIKKALTGKLKSEETKQKIQTALQGRVFTEEWKDRIRNGVKNGEKHSAESRKKQGDAIRGKPRLDLRGKKLSEEERKKISDGLLKMYANKNIAYTPS